MFSLENGQQYALSSNPSTTDLLQVDSKTYVFLKLTDSAFRAIEEFQKGNKKQKCVNKPKIQFTGDTGVIKLPGGQADSGRSYKFSLSSIDSSTSSTCIKHDGVRHGSRDVSTLGTMAHKISICADDDVYQQTRAKMTLAEEDHKKVCTKEIKPTSSKYRAKLNKKLNSQSSRPTTVTPEFKSSLKDRILAQKAAEKPEPVILPSAEHLKCANTKPSRVAHRPRAADAPAAATRPEPVPHRPPVKDGKVDGERPSFAGRNQPSPGSKGPPQQEKPSFGAGRNQPSPGGKVPTLVNRHSPNVREESLKRPAPPAETRETNVAKKPRCSEPAPPAPPAPRSPVCGEASDVSHLLDNAASHWTKKQPLNTSQSRNFFSDRRSPDSRPKLAVPPMPAPKPSEPDKSAEKAERPDKQDKQVQKTAESVKENQNTDDQYTSAYTEIQSLSQRVRYKQAFNAEYEEYQKLHSNISAVSRKFQRMENDLKANQEGTKMHEKIKKAIVQEYMTCKNDPRYLKDKSRFDHLHQKLSHIKKLIVDFDQRQISQ